jgi:hypothetical protein
MPGRFIGNCNALPEADGLHGGDDHPGFAHIHMLLADLLLVGSLPWERPGWNPLRGTATTLSPGNAQIMSSTNIQAD